MHIYLLCHRSTYFALKLIQSADLRGLEKDIHNKIKSCSPEDSDCSSLTKAALVGSFLTLGDLERVQFKFKLDNSQCVDTLKKCFEDNPKLQYLNTALYLDLALC